MFERYTESARRVLFFARYAVNEFGGTAIEPEHLLIGLAHGSTAVVDQLFARSGVSVEIVRREIEGRSAGAERLPTSAEIPFSRSAVRALECAVQEADRLESRNVHPEHLLLGVLRQSGSVAAGLLAAQGLHEDDVRKELRGRPAVAVPRAEPPQAVAEQIDRIKEMVAQLTQMPDGSGERYSLAQVIHESLEALKARLG